MVGRCEEFDRLEEAGRGEGGGEAAWREHLAACASCRGQSAVDALLREALPSPPAPVAGSEERLRRRLAERLGERPRPARRALGLRPVALWTLGAYGTAAAAASLLILARLPWQSLAASPAVGIALAVLALLSPLVLLDRVGVVRPPG